MRGAAIVTGASGGIGSRTAELLAEKGYAVVVCGHSHPERVADIVGKIRSSGGEATEFIGDMSIADTSKKAVELALKYYGRLDLIVCCAGAAKRALLSDINDEDYQKIMNINFGSVFTLAREASKPMITRQSGAMVFVSSMFGVRGASCESLYSAAKGAIVTFTQALAKELAPSGITVNCVAPGAIDTEMNADLNDEERRALCEEIPAGRFGTPGEVAEAIAFLADARYITGETLVIDGGYTL